MLTTASTSFSYMGTDQHFGVTLSDSSVATVTQQNVHISNLTKNDDIELPLTQVASNGLTTTYTTVAPAPIADGWYEAFVRKSGLTDGESQNTFRFLNGDFDGDGGVSINDFNILSTNFGKTQVSDGNGGLRSVTFADGDADYDGGVSIMDYFTVSNQFGKVLPSLPSQPGYVAIGNTNLDRLDVGWTADSEPRAGFKVYRSDDGQTYTLAATVADLEARSWPDNGTSDAGPLLDGHTYWYRVRSYTTTNGASASVHKVSGTVRSLTPATVGAVSTIKINAGQSASFSTSFADTDPQDVHLATVDWGDGTISTSTNGISLTESAGVGTITGGHAYTTHGVYHASLQVLDNDGATTTVPFTVVVGYVKPSFALSVVPQTGSSPATLSMTASGPEATGITSWMIDWGDGNTQHYNAPYASSGSSGAVWTPTHAYSDSTSHTIRVWASDSVSSSIYVGSISSDGTSSEVPNDTSTTIGNGGAITLTGNIVNRYYAIGFWNDVFTDETGYEVWYKPLGAADFRLGDTLPANGTASREINVADFTATHVYSGPVSLKVRAIGRDNTASDFSNTMTWTLTNAYFYHETGMGAYFPTVDYNSTAGLDGKILYKEVEEGDSITLRFTRGIEGDAAIYSYRIVPVNIRVSGSASPDDFSTLPTTVEFGRPGPVIQPLHEDVVITFKDDHKIESDETFSIMVDSPPGYTAFNGYSGRTRVIFTIKDSGAPLLWNTDDNDGGVTGAYVSGKESSYRMLADWEVDEVLASDMKGRSGQLDWGDDYAGNLDSTVGGFRQYFDSGSYTITAELDGGTVTIPVEVEHSTNQDDIVETEIASQTIGGFTSTSTLIEPEPEPESDPNTSVIASGFPVPTDAKWIEDMRYPLTDKQIRGLKKNAFTKFKAEAAAEHKLLIGFYNATTFKPQPNGVGIDDETGQWGPIEETKAEDVKVEFLKFDGQYADGSYYVIGGYNGGKTNLDGWAIRQGVSVSDQGNGRFYTKLLDGTELDYSQNKDWGILEIKRAGEATVKVHFVWSYRGLHVLDALGKDITDIDRSDGPDFKVWVEEKTGSGLDYWINVKKDQAKYNQMLAEFKQDVIVKGHNYLRIKRDAASFRQDVLYYGPKQFPNSSVITGATSLRFEFDKKAQLLPGFDAAMKDAMIQLRAATGDYGVLGFTIEDPKYVEK